VESISPQLVKTNHHYDSVTGHNTQLHFRFLAHSSRSESGLKSKELDLIKSFLSGKCYALSLNCWNSLPWKLLFLHTSFLLFW